MIRPHAPDERRIWRQADWVVPSIISIPATHTHVVYAAATRAAKT
jgi:hypothetical protein